MSEHEWEIALPAGLPVVSLNDRGHWGPRYRRGLTLRQAGFAAARAARVPRLRAISVRVTYPPPDRRRRDNDNIAAASGKHAIDGLVDARIIPDDRPPYVTAITHHIGAVRPRGQLVLHITEQPPEE